MVTLAVFLVPVILFLPVLIAGYLAWLVGRPLRGTWRWIAALACGVAVPLLAFTFLAFRLYNHPRPCPSPCDGPAMGLLAGAVTTVVFLLPLSIGASVVAVIIQNRRERQQSASS